MNNSNNRRYIQWSGLVLIVSVATATIAFDKIIYANIGFKICTNDGFNYPLFVLICALISIILCAVCNKKYITSPFSGFDWSKRFVQLMQNSSSGSLVDIAFLVSFVFYFSWIPDSLTDYIKEGESAYWWRPIVYTLGFIVTFLLKPVVEYKKNEIAKSSRKVLITGMSNIKVSSIDKEGVAVTNMDPILTVLKGVDKDENKLYSGIERILIITSTGILNGIAEMAIPAGAQKVYEDMFTEYKTSVVDKNFATEYCEIEGAIRKLLTIYAKTKYSIDITFDPYEELVNGKKFIQFSTPVNYDSVKDCYSLINSQTKAFVEQNGYTDDDVVINITSGPSALSGVMTLEAVIGTRELAYIAQRSPYEVTSYNPDVKLFENWGKALFKEYNQSE